MPWTSKLPPARRETSPLVFTAPTTPLQFADDRETEDALDGLLRDPRRWHPLLRDEAYLRYVDRQFARVYGDGTAKRDPDRPGLGPRPVARSIEPFPAPDPEAVAAATGQPPAPPAAARAPEAEPPGGRRGGKSTGPASPLRAPSGTSEPLRIPVTDLQTALGLDATGRVDHATRDGLEAALGDRMRDVWVEESREDGLLLAAGPAAAPLLYPILSMLGLLGATTVAPELPPVFGPDVIDGSDLSRIRPIDDLRDPPQTLYPDGNRDIPEIELPDVEQLPLDTLIPGWDELQPGDVFAPPWEGSPEEDPSGWIPVYVPMAGALHAALPRSYGRRGSPETQRLNWSLNRCFLAATERLGLEAPQVYGGLDPTGTWRSERWFQPTDEVTGEITQGTARGSYSDYLAIWSNFGFAFGTGPLAIGGNSQSTLADGVTPDGRETEQEIRLLRNARAVLPNFLYIRVPKGRTVNHERCVEWVAGLLRGMADGTLEERMFDLPPIFD